MNFTKDTPREEIERIIRETVYREMNLPLPRRAEGPNPLVVNVSARHAHLTKEAVEILFGKGYELTVHKWAVPEGPVRRKGIGHAHRPPQQGDLQPAHTRPVQERVPGGARPHRRPRARF